MTKITQEEKGRRRARREDRKKKYDPDPDSGGKRRSYDEIDDVIDNAEKVIKDNEKNTSKKEENAQ